MSAFDQNILHTILAQIDNNLSQGILPVHNGHITKLDDTDVLNCLLLMKQKGLISGDLVTRGAEKTPYRMTNIRLTYLGIRFLKS
jgi:hypothetical protein